MRKLYPDRGPREQVVRRLPFALDHGRDKMSRIVLRLFDVNDPHGGGDKRCAVKIQRNGAATVAIEDTEADPCVAIDRGRTSRTHAGSAAIAQSRVRRLFGFPQATAHDRVGMKRSAAATGQIGFLMGSDLDASLLQAVARVLAND